MKFPLCTLCLFLWTAGLLALLILKGALDIGPGTNAFAAAQGIWITGGLGYVFVGALTRLTEHAGQMRR